MLKLAKKLLIHTRNFFAVIAAFYIAMGISPAFQTFTGVSMRGASIGAQVLTEGLGILISGGVISIKSDVVPTKIEFSQNLDFGPIAASTCERQTISVPGVVVGDTFAVGPAATKDLGIIVGFHVATANVVTVDSCNVTGASITTSNQSFTGKVLR